MKKPRVYMDTSVIGGCFDPEFAAASQSLLDMVRDGRIVMLLSDLVADELADAPRRVQQATATLASSQVELIRSNRESENLRDAYLTAGVVGPARGADAHHVALATASGADLIVSWNFKHIVHYDKIRLFNAVNLREGYRQIDIRTPREVVP